MPTDQSKFDSSWEASFNLGSNTNDVLALAGK